MRAAFAALVAGLTGCGLVVGVDWDRVEVSGGVDCFGTNNAGQLGIDKGTSTSACPRRCRASRRA